MQTDPYTGYKIDLEPFTPDQQTLVKYAQDRLFPIYGRRIEKALRNGIPSDVDQDELEDLAMDQLCSYDTSTESLAYEVAQDLKRFGVGKYLLGYDIQNEEAITLAEIIQVECHPKTEYITFNHEDTLLSYAQAYVKWIGSRLSTQLTDLISEAIDEAI